MITVILIRNVSPNNSFGGIRKHCDNLYELFREDQTIFIPHISNIPSNYIKFINKRYFHFSDLYQYIKKANCDIIHLHGFMTLDILQVLIVAILLKKNIVYSPHFHPFKYLRRPMLGRLFFYLCLKFFLHCISAIITISNEDTIFFRKYHNNVIKIPHYFDNSNKKVIDSVTKKKHMILFIGRNESNKGIEHLYHLSSKYEVHCVTNGELLRSDFIIHNKISDDDLSKLYDEASLVVIPSRYEAFSYVALEAFSHNTPVVMSDRVQIAEYLNGIKGFNTFKYCDYEDFNRTVDKTIGTEVEMEKILDIFNKEIVKKKYQDVYINVQLNK